MYGILQHAIMIMNEEMNEYLYLSVKVGQQ